MTYYLQGSVVTTYDASRPGLVPYFTGALLDAGAPSVILLLRALSGASADDNLDTFLPAAIAETRALDLQPDVIVYIQSSPNSVDAAGVTAFEAAFPLFLNSCSLVWPNVPVIVTSGATHDEIGYPYWDELDAVKLAAIAARPDMDITYVDIFGIPLDGNGHPTTGIGGGENQIADRIVVAMGW